MADVVNKILTHTVAIDNRKSLTATGTLRIMSYDSQNAVLETSLGILSIGGTDLCVSELSVQTGEVKISGEIDFLQYTVVKERKDGLFKRLVR